MYFTVLCNPSLRWLTLLFPSISPFLSELLFIYLSCRGSLYSLNTNPRPSLNILNLPPPLPFSHFAFSVVFFNPLLICNIVSTLYFFPHRRELVSQPSSMFQWGRMLWVCSRTTLKALSHFAVCRWLVKEAPSQFALVFSGKLITVIRLLVLMSQDCASRMQARFLLALNCL